MAKQNVIEFTDQEAAQMHRNYLKLLSALSVTTAQKLKDELQPYPTPARSYLMELNHDTLPTNLTKRNIRTLTAAINSYWKEKRQIDLNLQAEDFYTKDIEFSLEIHTAKEVDAFRGKFCILYFLENCIYAGLINIEDTISVRMLSGKLADIIAMNICEFSDSNFLEALDANPSLKIYRGEIEADGYFATILLKNIHNSMWKNMLAINTVPYWGSKPNHLYNSGAGLILTTQEKIASSFAFLVRIENSENRNKHCWGWTFDQWKSAAKDIENIKKELQFSEDMALTDANSTSLDKKWYEYIRKYRMNP